MANTRPAAQRKVGFTAILFNSAAGIVAVLYLVVFGWPRISAYFSSDLGWHSARAYHVAFIAFVIIVCLVVLFHFKASLFSRPRVWLPFDILMMFFPFVLGAWGMISGNFSNFPPVGGFMFVVFALPLIPLAIRHEMSKKKSNKRVHIGDRAALLITACFIGAGLFMIPDTLFHGVGKHLLIALVIFTLPTTLLTFYEWAKEHPFYRDFAILGRGGAARFGGVYSYFKYDFDEQIIGAQGEAKPRQDGYENVQEGLVSPIYAGRTVWHSDPKIDGRHIGLNDDSHMLTVAMIGSGKSYYGAWNSLLMWRGGAFILDPKGEHYERTGRGHRVLDPWGLVSKGFRFDGGHGERINPLDVIDPNDPKARSDIMEIVISCIMQEASENANAKHFRENAQNLMLGVIAHVLTTFDEQYHNLPSIYDVLLTGDPDGGASDPQAFKDLITQMAVNEAVGRAPMDAAKLMQEAGENERGGFVTTCITGLKWVNDPVIRPVLMKSTFDLADIKRRKERLYFVIPFESMRHHSRFMRTMVAMALLSCREVSKHGMRTLFLLDEFYQLGTFKPIKDDLVTVRSREITVWMFLQNIGQIKENYDNWQGFMSSCNKQVFGVNDEETAEFVSRQLGDYVERWETQDADSPKKASRYDEKTRPLRTASEVLEDLRKGSGVQYVMPADGNPMRLRLVPFTKNYSAKKYGKVTGNRHD